MATVNQCNFMGCALHKGELRHVGSQANPMITFTVCVSGKNKEKEALFVRCVVFGKTAEYFDIFSQEKDTVFVTGELEKRKYKKDGVEKESYQLLVRELKLLPRAKTDFNRKDEQEIMDETVIDDNAGNCAEEEQF